MVIYRINFHLSPDEFKIGLYLNFEKVMECQISSKIA
jgi:hypothetical protein